MLILDRRAARNVPSGFTLVELLVVIAIIALLAAILFPVFGRARENARRSSCQSNLRQIGLGVMQYVQDFDETMLRVYYVGNKEGEPFSTSGDVGYRYQDPATAADHPTIENAKWMDVVFPYVKSEQIFVCPSAKKNGFGAASWMFTLNRYRYRGGAAPGGVGTTLFGSYALNASYSSKPSAPTVDYVDGPVGVKLARIAAAADTVMIAEGNGAYSFGPTSGSTKYVMDETYDSPIFRVSGSATNFTNNDVRNGQAVVQRHLEFTNVLYCDGHVKAKRMDEFANTKNMKWRSFQPNADIHTSLTIQDD